jgi:dihydrofolate reductase
VIISLIVAMDENGGIAKDNQLPWHLPSDLKRFKRLTMGHHLVVGRKTYETIGKPLPGRVMILLTRQKNYSAEGYLVVNSIKEAISIAEKNHENELFIIGGGEIFSQTIDLADKIYLTTVYADVDANIFFPKITPGRWELVTKEGPDRPARDQYKTDFKIFVRKY